MGSLLVTFLNTKNIKNKIQLFTAFIFISFIKIYAQTASISPSPNAFFCPGTSNSRTFTISLTGISKDSVQFSYDKSKSLTLVNGTTSSSGNDYLVTVTFIDQWQIEYKLVLEHRRTKVQIGSFDFTQVTSLLNRTTNFGPYATTYLADLCPNNISINVETYRYVSPGGNPNVPNNLFGSNMAAYQYLLPFNVTPISGLTPTPGSPNLYFGGTNIVVRTDNLNNATIKVRPFNSLCPQAFAGQYSDITIQRPVPELVRPGNSKSITLRCGDIAARTFTVLNTSTGSGCITNYTWKIANKGWKYFGTIPTTDIVTTTPTITLEPSNINSNPPKSFVVDITAGSEVKSSSITINYLAPTAIIAPAFVGSLDCNEQVTNATFSNLPITPHNIIWSTNAPNTINGSTLPQVNVGNSVTVTKLIPAPDFAQTKVTIAATCGNIESNSLTFAGCVPWENFGVSYFYPPSFCNDELRAGVNYFENFAVDYEWYAYYWGQYHLINTPYSSSSIQTILNINADEIYIYVRAKDLANSYTPLMTVVTYPGSVCGSYRMSNTSGIKVFPNPSSESIAVDYKSINGKDYTIKITSLMGEVKLVKKSNIKNTKVDVSRLKQGKYILTIIDGKNVKSTQIEIKR